MKSPTGRLVRPTGHHVRSRPLEANTTDPIAVQTKIIQAINDMNWSLAA
ncbi:hypothetical protein [Hydrogenophaga sp.]|jgi:hypothetical protein